MTKIWTRSLSGLQIYEGKKHIATVHYAGNPIVDVSEAMENAKLIEEAPILKAQQAELVKALTTISLVENYEQNFFEMQKIARNALAKVKGDA